MLDNDAEGCVSARASNHRVKSVRACHPLTRSAGPGTGGGGGIACFDDDFEAAFASMAASCRSREHVERCVTFLDRTTRPPSIRRTRICASVRGCRACVTERRVADRPRSGPATAWCLPDVHGRHLQAASCLVGWLVLAWSGPVVLLSRPSVCLSRSWLSLSLPLCLQAASVVRLGWCVRAGRHQASCLAGAKGATNFRCRGLSVRRFVCGLYPREACSSP